MSVNGGKSRNPLAQFLDHAIQAFVDEVGESGLREGKDPPVLMLAQGGNDLSQRRLEAASQGRSGPTIKELPDGTRGLAVLQLLELVFEAPGSVDVPTAARERAGSTLRAG